MKHVKQPDKEPPPTLCEMIVSVWACECLCLVLAAPSISKTDASAISKGGRMRSDLVKELTMRETTCALIRILMASTGVGSSSLFA